MSEKFHIDIHGKPVPCKAKQNCPRGWDSEHFPTVEEAQQYADEINSKLVNPQKLTKTALSKLFGLPKDIVVIKDLDDSNYNSFIHFKEYFKREAAKRGYNKTIITPKTRGLILLKGNKQYKKYFAQMKN